MPYKLLCRIHNSTMRRCRWTTIRRKKEDLINIYMANVSEGDTITVNLKRQRHCIMRIVKINHSDRTLDVISDLAQRCGHFFLSRVGWRLIWNFCNFCRDGQMDETAIRTVEWKQVVVKNSNIPAALTPQVDSQTTTSLEPTPLPPITVTSSTTGINFIPPPPLCPSPSLIEWEQESREIRSALFPVSTSIMDDDDNPAPPSKLSEPTSDSKSEHSLSSVLKTNSDMMDSDNISPGLCNDVTQEEDEDLQEYTPLDPDSPPSYSRSAVTGSSTGREDNTKMYLPPLYVLSPVEIQQACQALFTLPNWNNLINQVMAECVPSHLNGNNSFSHSFTPAV
ncbi:hypothetical protein CPB86DRAFT_501666 [Serendipita vermifera]|nr:hypothetical protein CPB86DRAFT_501666 [Serendipita vermifera]